AGRKLEVQRLRNSLALHVLLLVLVILRRRKCCRRRAKENGRRSGHESDLAEHVGVSVSLLRTSFWCRNETLDQPGAGECEMVHTRTTGGSYQDLSIVPPLLHLDRPAHPAK